MPKQGGGRRTPEASPRYTSKYPMAGTDTYTRTYTAPGENSYVQYYKDAADYALRDKPEGAGKPNYAKGGLPQRPAPHPRGLKDLP